VLLDLAEVVLGACVRDSVGAPSSTGVEADVAPLEDERDPSRRTRRRWEPSRSSTARCSRPWSADLASGLMYEGKRSGATRILLYMRCTFVS